MVWTSTRKCFPSGTYTIIQVAFSRFRCKQTLGCYTVRSLGKFRIACRMKCLIQGMGNVLDVSVQTGTHQPFTQDKHSLISHPMFNLNIGLMAYRSLYGCRCTILEFFQIESTHVPHSLLLEYCQYIFHFAFFFHSGHNGA